MLDCVGGVKSLRDKAQGTSHGVATIYGNLYYHICQYVLPYIVLVRHPSCDGHRVAQQRRRDPLGRAGTAVGSPLELPPSALVLVVVVEDWDKDGGMLPPVLVPAAAAASGPDVTSEDEDCSVVVVVAAVRVAVVVGAPRRGRRRPRLWRPWPPVLM